MSRRWRSDEHRLLKVSGTQIRMAAPWYVTIGGQQYKGSSDLFLTLTGLSANQLYMVYAVQSGGVVSLVQSTNPNSVGPAGYSAWKLVGAFYASGIASPDFGSFVNIEGTPSSELMPYTPSFTNFSIGNGAARFFWGRRSDSAQIRGIISFGSASSLSGELNFNLPTSFSMDGSKLSGTNVNGDNGRVGWAGAYDNAGTGTRELGYVFRLGSSATTFAVEIRTDTGSQGRWSTTFPITWAVADEMHFEGLSVPILGWSATPLKEL